MSEITQIIPYSNFELIRSKIASILADELANQKTLYQAALAAEEAKPPAEQDASLIAFYNLSIDCIPSVVWEERFFRPQPEEMPILNVVLLNVPLNEGTNNTGQVGENKYQIEVYQQAKSKSGQYGDVLATEKLHRLLAIIRVILMDRNYVDLALSNQIVRRRQVQDIIIGLPNLGADDANSSIFGKLDLLVKSVESVTDLDGVTAQIGLTNMKIFDSEKGYFWEI